MTESPPGSAPATTLPASQMSKRSDGILGGLNRSLKAAQEQKLINAVTKEVKETAKEEVRTVIKARAEYVRRVRQLEKKYGAPKGHLFHGEMLPDGTAGYKYLRTEEARRDDAELTTYARSQFQIGVDALKEKAQPALDRQKIPSAPEDRICNAPTLYNRVFGNVLLDLHRMAESVVDAEEATAKAKPGDTLVLPPASQPTTQKGR